MTTLLHHLAPLVVAIFVALLGIFVYKNNSKSITHLTFFLFAEVSFVWQLFYFIAKIAPLDYKLLFFKVGFTFVIFIAIGIYHFVASYAESLSDKYFIKLAYLIGAFFASMVWFTNFIINDSLNLYKWGYYPRAGILHPILIVFFTALLFRANIVLFFRYKRSRETNDKLEETKSKLVFIALFLYSLASIDFIPNYGFGVYPIGFLLLGIYSTMMAYSILKYKFLDIEVIIKRAAVFAGLFAFVYGVFAVFTVVGQGVFEGALHWNRWMAMVPTIVIIVFTLRPLENFLTNATERFLFQKKYDYRVLLRTFTNEILTILDLQQLIEQTVVSLIKIIKVESACVLLFDKDQKLFKLAAASGISGKDVSFKEDDELIYALKASSQHILRDKNSDKMGGHSGLREDFKKLNARLCLPIELHDQLIGVLCLGMKKSGEDYTQEDIDILMTLAKTEAIAISNARLFDELSKTQAEAAQREKMAVIGTLAAGINHEICNPLGIVRGNCEMFLLNVRDGVYKDKSQEDIFKIFSDTMTKVIKETDRATAITKKLSSFAKPSKRMGFEEVWIDKEVEEVLGLVEHDMKLNNIVVQRDFPENFPAIFADKKQIEEVLFNIIRNAAQAMDKEDGRILLSGFTENGSVAVRIADNGSGIPKDKIDQIFNPFYTTKAPGKGTGLGLFIVKQVIERNQGVISLESEEGVGTTFTLKFPLSTKAVAGH